MRHQGIPTTNRGPQAPSPASLREFSSPVILTESAADAREQAIVQTRRAEALPDFRTASPLHEKERDTRRGAGCRSAWLQPCTDALAASRSYLLQLGHGTAALGSAHNVRPRVLSYNNPRQNHEVVQTAVTVDTQRRRRVAELAQYVPAARLRAKG